MFSASRHAFWYPESLHLQKPAPLVVQAFMTKPPLPTSEMQVDSSPLYFLRPQLILQRDHTAPLQLRPATALLPARGPLRHAPRRRGQPARRRARRHLTAPVVPLCPHRALVSHRRAGRLRRVPPRAPLRRPRRRRRRPRQHRRRQLPGPHWRQHLPGPHSY
jgi:hypothetical protein